MQNERGGAGIVMEILQYCEKQKADGNYQWG